MSFILYIILFFFLFIILSAVGLLGAIARIFFKSPRNNDSNSQKNYQNGSRQSSTKWYTYGKKKKKIFDKNDGEYVDFEEVKDDK